MKRTFQEAIVHRYSCYRLGSSRVVDEQLLEAMMDEVLAQVPSAFNIQTARIVLLWHEAHQRFWELVKEALRLRLTVEQFATSQAKIDTQFAAGYGTFLFYEEQALLEQAKVHYPTYANQMDAYVEQSAGMHQFVLWTMLEDAGLGASLQHYNPLIDQAVAKEWGIPPAWRLVAQMPFGVPLMAGEPHSQTLPVAERRRVLQR